jgi:hypothetical protein
MGDDEREKRIRYLVAVGPQNMRDIYEIASLTLSVLVDVRDNLRWLVGNTPHLDRD